MISLDQKMKELDTKLTAILEAKLFQIKSELLAVVEQELTAQYETSSTSCLPENDDSSLCSDETINQTQLTQDELNQLVLSHAKHQRIGLGNQTITEWLSGRVTHGNDLDSITSDLLFNMVETVIEEAVINDISEEMVEKVVEFLINHSMK